MTLTDEFDDNPAGPDPALAFIDRIVEGHPDDQAEEKTPQDAEADAWLRKALVSNGHPVELAGTKLKANPELEFCLHCKNIKAGHSSNGRCPNTTVFSGSGMYAQPST